MRVFRSHEDDGDDVLDGPLALVELQVLVFSEDVQYHRDHHLDQVGDVVLDVLEEVRVPLEIGAPVLTLMMRTTKYPKKGRRCIILAVVMKVEEYTAVGVVDQMKDHAQNYLNHTG